MKSIISIPRLFSVLASVAAAHAAVVPHELRCEYRENPLGVDVIVPRLQWKIPAGGPTVESRGWKQKFYQVLVASSAENLAADKGDLWDSGKVESDSSIQIAYAGKPLESRMRCHWKVRVWDHQGKPSGWSRPQLWTVGLLDESDWQAHWIGVEEPKASETAAPLQAGELRLVSAAYQEASGGRQIDVTALLSGKIVRNTLLVSVDNETLGGDPAPGAAKRLVVEYELAGKLRKKSVDEKAWLAINIEGASESEWAKPRYLRKGFEVGKKVLRATVHATALGVYELRLNGKRVGDHLLAPEWTDYRKRVQYQTHDVTEMVRRGDNVLAAVVGNGWYAGAWQHWKPKIKPIYGTEPFFMAQLEVEFSDGSRQVVVTDDTWRGTTDGPLRFAGIYEGVTYDATREMPGWDAPGFDDARWKPVKAPAADVPIGKRVWQRGQPIRATREIKPVALTEPKPGVYVYAFDQNMVGHTRFTFRGGKGDTVELQHGEMLNPDGTVFLGNLLVVSEHRIQLDRYTFRSDQPETYEPAFTYHGFQYVEVRGLDAKPDLDSLTGVVANSDCPEVGGFTCSDPALSRLAQNILWSQRGNYMGVPTDCPQRNERCGYTGDAQFFMRAAVYNMDVSAFFNRWLVDVCQDSQMPDGHFADHAPTYGPGDGPNIGWSDAGIICPYEIYRNYGDTRVIREHYPAMKRKLEWLSKNSTNHLFTGKIGNGDWLSTGGGVANDVLATAYCAFDFKLMAEMAAAIGETRDAAAFRAQADQYAAAFTKAFIDADGNIRQSSQSGFAMAFTMGLVPENMREKMTARFVGEVRKFDWQPRTGFIGTPRLLPGLHLAGRDDDAYKMLLNRKNPSWLYPVTVGATTIWEQWSAWDGKNPRGGMNSLNHYAFGAVGEYLFGMVGGIQAEAPGYRKIRIQPVIREGLDWVKTHYDSIHGRIVSHWEKVDGKLAMDVAIPPNTTATIHVPARNPDQVSEAGKPAAKAKGLKFLRMENGAAVFEAGSGFYQFEVMP